MKPRLLLIFLLYAALLLGSWYLSDKIVSLTGFQPTTNDPMMMGISAVYILTAALPFVPGAEIGFALLATFGADAALLVYLSMVIALSLAFLAGRFVPTHWLVVFFRYLGIERAAEQVETMSRLPPQQREDFLLGQISNRYCATLLKYRYLAFALVLNLPGNSLVGGGGGLALLAGMSRLFNMAGFFATVLLAVAPVPFLVSMTGYHPWS